VQSISDFYLPVPLPLGEVRRGCKAYLGFQPVANSKHETRN